MMLYSAVYNGSYMIPEIIITTIAAVLIAPYAKTLKDKQEV